VFRCGSPDHSRVWRGFPIRTPWDHSPVIDSPRLIADSYVLLRLLMPRHPPCALKNLTTKDQKTNFERTTKTNHTQQHHPARAVPSRAARSRFIFLEIASYKRCSRPLCSSQTTTPHHTPHTHPPRQKAKKHPCDRCSQETRNTSPENTAATKPQHPRPCCLRTQQCAKHYPPAPTTPRSRTPAPSPEREETKIRTNKTVRATRHLFVDIPPMSTRRRTIACATGHYS
jgi:hypothetical protein